MAGCTQIYVHWRFEIEGPQAGCHDSGPWRTKQIREEPYEVPTDRRICIEARRGLLSCREGHWTSNYGGRGLCLAWQLGRSQRQPFQHVWRYCLSGHASGQNGRCKHLGYRSNLVATSSYSQVHFTGVLPKGVTGKDVMVALCGLFDKDDVLNHAIEFTGSDETLRSLQIDDRLTIANMTTEWGALTGSNGQRFERLAAV